MDVRYLQFARIIVVVSAICVSCNCKAMENLKICPVYSEEQIINAAITRIVNAGASQQLWMRKIGCADRQDRQCYNAFPYSSVTDFRHKNPGCCSILAYIPGDMPLTYRPNIRGEIHPKMYLVELKFKAYTWKDDVGSKLSEYEHHSITTIDCFGNPVRNDN